MLNQRQRPIFLALVALVVIWAAAFTGYRIAQHVKVTPDKVRTYVGVTDLSRLPEAGRAAAIRKVADMLNALTFDERQSLRFDHTVQKWFEKMTEAEKGDFIAATLPTGFKQMINAFETLPPEKRQRLVEQSIRQLKAQREKLAASGQFPLAGTNDVRLSQDLQDKATKIGLQSFYSQSSAQTKAELAPFLEEMQRTMESARMLHTQ
ncbi:MAG TPA: hypothetical protein VF988_02465 [Verrucomicrobiae bacterium]